MAESRGPVYSGRQPSSICPASNTLKIFDYSEYTLFFISLNCLIGLWFPLLLKLSNHKVLNEIIVILSSCWSFVSHPGDYLKILRSSYGFVNLLILKSFIYILWLHSNPLYLSSYYFYPFLNIPPCITWGRMWRIIDSIGKYVMMFTKSMSESSNSDLSFATMYNSNHKNFLVY